MSFDRQLVIEPLNRDHNRETFNCGNDTLSNYLKQQATQDINRHVSRIFIARSPRNKTTILGYYTLSTLSIDLSDLPEKVARKLPKHPMPAALIGRLAVELSMQGHGFGQMLLANALKRTLAVAEEIGIYAVVVDAINKEAACFYTQYGFTHLAKDSRRLFLQLKTL